jgi:hypothetical protein
MRYERANLRRQAARASRSGLGTCVENHGPMSGTSSAEQRYRDMPERETVQRARKAKREGKAPTSQAGEFVREEIHHVREGKHGARSTKQAIAIGLSKARRAGVKLARPPASASKRTKQSAESASRAGRRRPRAKPSRTRSRATIGALKREGRQAASRKALARQARTAARRRSPAARRASARRAVRTKGPRVRKMAAKRAARTRQRRRQASLA